MMKHVTIKTMLLNHLLMAKEKEYNLSEIIHKIQFINTHTHTVQARKKYSRILTMFSPLDCRILEELFKINVNIFSIFYNYLIYFYNQARLKIISKEYKH